MSLSQARRRAPGLAVADRSSVVVSIIRVSVGILLSVGTIMIRWRNQRVQRSFSTAYTMPTGPAETTEIANDRLAAAIAQGNAYGMVRSLACRGRRLADRPGQEHGRGARLLHGILVGADPHSRHRGCRDGVQPGGGGR